MKKIILIIIVVIICGGGITAVVINNNNNGKENIIESTDISKKDTSNTNSILEQYIKNMQEGNYNQLCKMFNIDKFNEIIGADWESEKIKDTYKEISSNMQSYNVNNTIEIKDKSDVEKILDEKISDNDLKENIIKNIMNYNYKIFQIDVSLLDKNNNNQDIKDIIVIDDMQDIVYNQMIVLMNINYKSNTKKVNEEKREPVVEEVTQNN